MVDLGPCLHEPPLSPRQLAADELDRIDSKNADLILIEGMKVGPMVRGQRLGEHRQRAALDTPEFVEAFDIGGGESYVPAIRR